MDPFHFDLDPEKLQLFFCFFSIQIYNTQNHNSSNSVTLERAKMRVRTFILPIIKVRTFILPIMRLRTFIMGKLKVHTSVSDPYHFDADPDPDPDPS